MVGLISAGGGGPDYIQSDEPQNPQNGETWFDTDAGSDGTGELKIYDGDAGAWKITGFTAHGDLTGVTRDAHHPPVEVSGPLTQPSDQSLGLSIDGPLSGGSSLGLSIGDGLANSAGTLVAALGNGLGIDGSGRVYVPAGALSHGAEVDTPADAHHTRYSDAEASAAAPVQTVNGQTGDVSVSQPTQADGTQTNGWTGFKTGSASADYNNTDTTYFSFSGHIGGIEAQLSGDDGSISDITVNFQSGASWSIPGAGGRQQVGTVPSGEVTSVDCTVNSNVAGGSFTFDVRIFKSGSPAQSLS